MYIPWVQDSEKYGSLNPHRSRQNEEEEAASVLRDDRCLFLFVGYIGDAPMTSSFVIYYNYRIVQRKKIMRTPVLFCCCCPRHSSSSFLSLSLSPFLATHHGHCQFGFCVDEEQSSSTLLFILYYCTIPESQENNFNKTPLS